MGSESSILLVAKSRMLLSATITFTDASAYVIPNHAGRWGA